METKCWLCDKEASAWHDHLCDEHLGESNLGSVNIREETQSKAERALRQLDEILARGPK